MLHCIIKRERHPDRGIEDVIGPFLTDGDANAACDKLNEAEDAGDRMFRYSMWSMTPPEEA